MATALLEAPDAVDKHIEVYCQSDSCKKPIKKKKNQSWAYYATRKYCDRICLGREQSRIQSEKVKVKQLPDGTIMPIGKYLEARTENGKLQADFYVGIMKEVSSHKIVPDSQDSVKLCVKCQNIYYGYYYKGLLITTDLASKAADWLTMNTFGRYGQRKAPDEKPKRTVDELKHRLRFLIKKLVKSKDVAGKIIVLLEGEGL